MLSEYAIENLPIIVLSVGQDGVIKTVTSHIHKLLGIHAEEIVGRKFDDMVTFDNDEANAAIYERNLLDEEATFYIKDIVKHVMVSSAIHHEKGGDVWVIMHDNDFIHDARSTLSKMQFVFDRIPMTSILLFDKDFRYIYASGDELSKAGYDPSLMVGKTVYDILGESISDVIHFYKRVLDKNVVVEEYVSSNTGNVYEIAAIPILNPEGEFEAGLIISRNITARKNAEKALGDSERRLTEILDATVTGIALIHKDGNILKSNISAHQIVFDSSSKSLLDIPYLKNESDLAAIEMGLNVANAGSFWRKTIPTCRYGKDFWIDFSLKPMEGEDGSIDLIVLEVIDVTQQIEAENALADQVYQMNVITETLPMAMLIYDLETGKIYYHNDEFTNIHGVSGSYVGFNANSLYSDPDDINEVRDGMNKFGKMNGVEVPIDRISGGTFWAVAWIYKIKYANKDCLLALFFDDTDRHEEKIKLGEALNELKVLNDDLENFAYVASHDLKEPLRMITSFVGLLQMQYEDIFDDRAKEFMGFITEGTSRMKLLLDDLLLYSRTGRSHSPQKTSALSLLKSALDDLSKLIIDHDVTIIHPDEMPEIYADRVQIIRLFQNLIANGIKYNHSSNKQIHISTHDKGDLWEFHVTDNGIGICKEDYEKIFIIFQRLHNRDEYEGTGIGLSICKRIVSNHDGEIGVKSSVGKGTTIWFTIPKIKP